MERRQKRMEEGRRKGADDEEGEEEWPSMPPGYRILSSEEQAEKMREESKMSQSPDIVDTPTPTDLLNDLQMASDGNLFSSFPPDSNDESGEASGISDSLLAVFDDRLDSPLACPIVVDTIPDDDDSLLFPGTSHRN